MLKASTLVQSVLLAVALFAMAKDCDRSRPQPRSVKPAVVRSTTPKKVAPKKLVAKSGWRQGVVTTYHDKFNGRHASDGSVFLQSKRTVACWSGKLGSKIEIVYNGRHRSVVKLTDRGGNLHRQDRWHFDVSRRVALDLGLYKVDKYGHTVRTVRWRFIK